MTAIPANPALAVMTFPWDWPSLGIAGAIHLVCFILVSAHCLRTRREPASTLLWIFVAWAFPVIGPLLYAAIGVDRVPEKGFRKHVRDQALLEARRAREADAYPLAYWRRMREAVAAEPAHPLARSLDRSLGALLPEHPLLGGNAVEPLVGGDEAYPPMFDAIRAARRHVHLQSFIVSNDRVGRDLLDLLADKARAGVEVRVLFDRFGSTRAFLGGFFRRYRGIPNLAIAGWTQANPLKRQMQINLRNHRKILIVDGHTAFCGGLNIHDENVLARARAPIRDYHFLVRGPAVSELQYTFLRDWHFMTDCDAESILTESYFPHVPPSGSAAVRVVNSGPSGAMEAIADTFFLAIVAAERQILAVTPYFVPTPDIVRALRAAALRGVDVRLIVPAHTNHVCAGLAGRALYDELLAAGARIYQRRPPFMHAKALLVDNAFALVGTANLDARSLRLNYETNLAVFDERFADRMKRIVLDDEAQSDELALADWRRRPALQRVAENLSYLMAPVL